MNISHLFDGTFCIQLSLALLHFVWQGALIAGGAILAAWLVGRDSPQRRYRTHLTALALMLLCLPVTLGVVVRSSPVREPPVAGADPGVSSAAEIEMDGAPWRGLSLGPSEVVTQPDPVSVPNRFPPTAPWLRKEAWARWTVWGYLAGVAVMFARVCLAVLGGRRLRRRASPLSEPDLLEAIRAQLARLGLRIAPSVAWCDRVLVPVVIGMIKPAILLPASLATGLTPGQLQLVIAHELAHLYRWDHIALVFQRVVEAVFFFHPAVWYISRRLSVERELCCDELVLRAGSNAGEYAESLLRVAELSRPAATAAPLVAIAMARGGRGSRALVQRLSRILGQPECSPVRLVNPWPLAVGLAVCLGAALICGSAGNLRVLAHADSAKGNTPRANENGADDTAVDLAVEKNAVAALRAMHVRTAGDLNTTPLGTVEFWGVPTGAWQHIGRLSSLRELRIVASDVRGRPFEQIGGLKNLRRLTVINSKCSPTDLAQVAGLRNLEHLDIAFTVFDENDTWRSGQLGQLTPGERELIDRYLASRPAGQAEQYRRMIEVAVLTDRALQHLRGLKRLRTMKLINTNITGSGLDCLKDLPALEELDLPLIAFSADVARVLGGMQSLRRFRYADVTDECLAEIARLSRLEELELFGDGVTDRGAEHLRRLVNLRKLSIRGSQMTDGGLRQLADLPDLQYLDLRFSSGALSEASVTEFRAQKPGCQVLFQPIAKEDSTPPNRPVGTQDKEDAAKKTVALTVRIARAADATTKAVVKSFTIVPASYEERLKHVTWQSQYRKRYTGTPAEFRMERPWKATVLRIEADGYVPILTRPFRRDEGQVNVDLTFAPDPGSTGKVVTPGGEPAAGASLALCTWTNEVNVQGGRLSYAGHGRELGKLNTSAADGTFRIPSEPDPSVLVVAHDSGYAEVRALTSSTIHLKPWGRIEGECVVNGKPIADQAIHIGAGRGDVEVNLHYSDDVATDAAGRFGVDRVPPVALYVQPWFKRGESAFSLLWFSGRTAIAAGQTTRITLPRVGRPLMGRVSVPAESGLRLADLAVEAELSLRPPSMSMRSGDELNREYAAYQAFLKSDLGRVFRREGIAVNADGTFRIEGLPEAHYVLYVTAYGKPAGPGGDRGPALARVVRRVEVPPLVDSEEPVDLGNLVLGRSDDPKPSQKRPVAEALREGPAAGAPLQIEPLEGGLDGPIILDRGRAIGSSSAEAGVEAFLARVAASSPSRRGRVSYGRNQQGEIIILRAAGVTLQEADFTLIGQLQRLEALDLSQSNVTDDDLRQLGRLANLRELKLGETRIDGSGLEHLDGLDRLERLELGDTKVSDDSLRHLTKLGNLRHLRLVGTQIGDTGLMHLARIGGLQSLKLTRTKVTDEGLRSLRSLGELRGLTLDETKVTEAGLKYLAELPRFAWAASALATAQEFVRRIERGDHAAVAEMHSLGPYIPDSGKFQSPKLDAIPVSDADRARGWQRFHVEMHWTWEAQKLDGTFFADFAVERATINVHQTGVREQPRHASPDSKKDSRSSAAAIPVPDAQPPAPEPKPDQAKERERLQGTWAVTKVTVNGNVVTDPDLSGATVVFQENDLAVKKGDRTMERFALRMDSTADPKAFHATRVEPKSPEQSGWMIYALTGDTLQIGFCNALKVRPAGFEPREDLVVLGLSRAAAIPKPKKSESAPGKAPLEGTVLEVLPDGMIKVSLGTDNGLRVGDVLHVWRPAQGGAVQLLADVIVRVAEKTFAKCLVLQLLGPADAPVRKGDAVSRWPPEPTRRRSRGKMPTMEGQVVSVTPAQEVGISLGSDDGLKVGDTLHVRRQAPDGSSRSLAIIVVKTAERASATCAVLHELADPPPRLPLEKGDIAARWCPVGKVLSVQGDVVEISLGKDARLTRGERIFVCRDSTPGTKEQVTELTVDTIGDKSTTCKIRPGLDKGERWPVRAGDWAIPHRTEFFNLDYGGAEEKGSDQAVRRDRGGEAVFWVFSLKHAAAEEVAKAVASRFNAQRDFKVMPDSRRNAVCVYCTQELQEKIGSEIRSLDSQAKVCSACGNPLDSKDLHNVSVQGRVVFLCCRQCGEGMKDIICRTVKPPGEVPQAVAGVLTYGIIREDFNRLKATIPNIRAIVPIREQRRRFTSGTRSVEGRLVECNPEYAELTRLEVDRGRFLGDSDLTENRKNCVLASGTAETLFRTEDPVGQSILIDDSRYQVVGVMKRRAVSAGSGGLLAAQDFTHDVYVPITFDRDNVRLSQITLRVDKVEHVLKTAELIRETLRQRHKIEDYSVTIPLELVRSRTELEKQNEGTKQHESPGYREN
jgi:uncharacterized protein (TIGR03067 family)